MCLRPLTCVPFNKALCRIISSPRADLSGNAFRPGDRVRIRALRHVGSARLLHGLIGEVIARHPIATGWYKVRLDHNEVTPHALWSVPGERLARIDDPSDAESAQSSLLAGIIEVEHLP